MRVINSVFVFCVFVGFAGTGVLAQQAEGLQLQYTLEPQMVIQDRLGAYSRKNVEREPAVRKLFEEAGCKDDALVEQSVKGVKAPNLVCNLGGTSDSTIVVGAHFDLVEAGNGVVDNWTGA